jgi:mono/diheme cytochrome c family protein
MRAALLALAVAATLGCDNRQAFHAPEPGLERMLEQPRANPYSESSAFSDGRAMRTPPPGTRARGATTVEPVIDRALLARGRVRFDIACAPCHGVLGDGQSVVATKMSLRRPPSLHEPRLRAYGPERIYDVIVTGYGLMPSYAAYLSVEDRWAVAAYVRALQLSRHATAADLPAVVRRELEESAP